MHSGVVTYQVVQGRDDQLLASTLCSVVDAFVRPHRIVGEDGTLACVCGEQRICVSARAGVMVA